MKKSIQEESANKFIMGKKAADERREKNKNNEVEDVNMLDYEEEEQGCC